MIYTYSKAARKLAIIALVCFIAFLLLRIEELMALFRGNFSGLLITSLFLQIIFVPDVLFLGYLKKKRIVISTDEEGLTFDNSKKKVQILWDEVRSIKFVTGAGIKVSAYDKSFSFLPTIEPENTPQKTTDYGITKIKNCLLLQEIREKATNVKIEGYIGTILEPAKSKGVTGMTCDQCGHTFQSKKEMLKERVDLVKRRNFLGRLSDRLFVDAQVFRYIWIKCPSCNNEFKIEKVK